MILNRAKWYNLITLDVATLIKLAVWFEKEIQCIEQELQQKQEQENLNDEMINLEIVTSKKHKESKIKILSSDVSDSMYY